MKQWYTVEMLNQVVRWSDCFHWCTNTFGSNPRIWNYSGFGRFNFSDEQYKILFLLRWNEGIK